MTPVAKAILQLFRQAAADGAPCPTNAALYREVDCGHSQGSQAVRFLRAGDYIEVQQRAEGAPARRVKVNGKWTAWTQSVFPTHCTPRYSSLMDLAMKGRRFEDDPRALGPRKFTAMPAPPERRSLTGNSGEWCAE